ncbi:MAG: hypothetical protein LBN33_00495 [Desulfovibrio sp.]|nr:hypothetical protein [Desulfovibrio sp.]
MAVRFQKAGQFRQMRGHFFGNAGRTAGRVKGKGIVPDGLEQGADFRFFQLVQFDPTGAGVGEMQIHAAATGKLRIQVKTEAHIGNNQERRAAFIERQTTDVIFRLPSGPLHGVFPLARAALDSGRGGHAGQRKRGGFILSLLGFQHKTALTVQIQAFEFFRAVPARHIDLALKGIGIFFVDRSGGIGPGQFQGIAQFRQKKLGIGLF